MLLLIVNYHYFRDKKPKRGIYPLSLKEFSFQLDAIYKYYDFISQEELALKIKNRKFDNKNYCLLTFDDGLKEQMLAFDILKIKGIPGVFYVSTFPIANHKVLDVHKLHYIRSVIDDEKILNYINYKLNIDINKINFPNKINELYRYDNIDVKRLKYLLNFILNEDIKKEVINSLFNDLIDEAEFSRRLYMDKEDIQILDKYKCLGTHTHTHLPLATLSNKQIEGEIEDSMKFLNNECSVENIISISYPYGGPQAVNSNVANISKKFNFSFGLTMFRGINSNNDFNNPLLLKRVDTNDAPGGKLGSKEYCL